MSTPSTAYHNTVTFLDSRPVATIQVSDRLVLDGYVFDVNELIERLRTNPDQIYSNPHNGALFTETAMQTQRDHTLLGTEVLSCEDMLNTYPALLAPITDSAPFLATLDLIPTLEEMPAGFSQMLYSSATLFPLPSMGLPAGPSAIVNLDF